MRLWFDDVRLPPDGWEWARTVEKAKAFLLTGEVVECSLDHDMGLEMLDVEEGEPGDWDTVIELASAAGHRHAETGYDLVNWMIDNDCVPKKITIHSWNPDGAMAMATRLANCGHECWVAPFKPGGP